MKTVGSVLALFISEKYVDAPISKEKLSLDEHGIIGDKHYGTLQERTVLISSVESYTITESLNIKMPHGYLGENLLLDFNPYHLPIGSYIQIGTSLLEITQNCTLCNHLAKLDKRIPKLLKNDRGIFAKVVKAGKIEIGDAVSLL